MRKLKGWELVGKAKGIFPQMKTICVSGSEESTENFDRFLQKPFTLEEFKIVVGEIIAV